MAGIELSQQTEEKFKTEGISFPWEAVAALLRFLGQRLAQGALVLLAVCYISFVGFNIAAGNELGTALGAAVGDTLAYLGQAAGGNLGMTNAARADALNLPVAEVLPEILGRSFGLLAISLLGATLVGVTLGVRAATRRGGGRSLLLLLTSIIGVSAPSFLIALLLQILVIEWNQNVGSRLLPVGGFGWDRHLVLPALVLGARPLAQITRMTFVSVTEVLAQDHVRTARSKGLRGYQVLNAHVLRNAAVPILTTVGLSLRFMLSSLPVVEFFFGWPGAGFTLLRAISEQDRALAVALLLSLGAFFIVVNVLLEAVYRLIDPRLRQTPDHMASAESATLGRRLRSWGQTVRDFVVDNALTRWWRRRREPAPPNPFKTVLAHSRHRERVSEADMRRFNWHAWRRGTLANPPFFLGGLLLLGLLVVFLFGPQLAPHSPYDTQGLVFVDGEFKAPPFPPDNVYPLGTDVIGRDILSLILAGAQQTLLLAVLVVMARLLLGFLLGAMAGWWSGGWLDRTILGMGEVLAAFPTLLLGMLLILALGIREGLATFLIALSLIGWGEIMQYVRSEVIAIRPEPFIESAVATGARTPRIILAHVLPNLLAALISLAALEMGATLMLLGELGFLGIFIGGGAFAELDVFGALYHYSDVPEWGSLLANIRTYARPYPWTAIYPALAFFVAILAFNFFGEGIRRLIQVVGVEFTRLLNRYTFAGALLLFAGAGWMRANSGPMGYYRQQAELFSGERAMAHVEALVAPEMEGRALGSEGLEEAAAYIAGEFEALGLQKAGEEYTYFQPRPRSYARLAAVPRLEWPGAEEPLVYRQDYVELTAPEAGFANGGSAQGPVTFFATGPLQASRAWFGPRYPGLRNVDYTGQIVMLLSPADVNKLWDVPHAGILVVADDEQQMQRRATLATINRPQVPMLWISEETANRLLVPTGHTVAALREAVKRLNPEDVISRPTGEEVRIVVDTVPVEKGEAAQVVGHLPGKSAALDNRVILVMAQYDAPPAGPGGPVPGAVDNASSVGLMLEIIRTMQESGYTPYKTFLFVAYAGEGRDQGEPAYPPDVEKFLQAKYGFANNLELEAVVDLRGVGGGSGDRLAVSAGGSLRLAELFEKAAARVGVESVRLGEQVDVSVIFDERNPNEGGQEAPRVGLQWEGWQALGQTPADTLQAVSAQRLQEAGKAITLALMTIGRETDY